MTVAVNVVVVVVVSDYDSKHEILGVIAFKTHSELLLVIKRYTSLHEWK